MQLMQLMHLIDSHTANKNVSLCLNVSTEMSGARRSAGRLFHVRGPSLYGETAVAVIRPGSWNSQSTRVRGLTLAADDR